MSPESTKKLETRIFEYARDLPEAIALMLYQQFYARGMRIDGIGLQIERALKTTELTETCSCQGKHATGVPFSHWLAGDPP